MTLVILWIARKCAKVVHNSSQVHRLWASEVWRHIHASYQSGQALLGTREMHIKYRELLRKNSTRGKGPYSPLWPDESIAGVPIATTIAHNRRAYETNQRNMQFLWLLLQRVVQCKYNDNAGNRGVWIKLEHDMHKTNDLCKYLHWKKDFEISSVILQKNRQILLWRWTPPGGVRGAWKRQRRGDQG